MTLPVPVRVAGCYLLFIAVANLVWEFAQMPLYTLWTTGSVGEIYFAALHCTVGDLMIAAGALALAVVIFGGRSWPQQHYLAVAAAAIVFGMSYTIFSEWLNIEIQQSWAYRDLMPQLPPLGTGLTPLLQWLLLPPLGFWYAHRRTRP